MSTDAATADRENADAETEAITDGSECERSDVRNHPLAGRHYDEAELPVFPPAIARNEVESSGRVGAVAYPYRVYEAEIEVERPLLSPRRDRRIVSVDCSRRLALRADEVPEFETKTVTDALVLPSELSPEQADEKAHDAAFKWTLRTSILSDVPDVEFGRVADAYKLFWLVERPDGDLIIDSVRGTEQPLDG